MLDGFLLFSVLDVWRVLLPSGLAAICLGTLAFQRFVGPSQENHLIRFLPILTYRMTGALVGVLAVVGIVVPWVLGFNLLEVHLTTGPWSYEEICGYFVALGLLWRLHHQVRHGEVPSGLVLGGALIALFGAAFLWIARWDAMAHMGQVPDGWLLASSVDWEWSRLIPKWFHLLFSSLVAGGLVVASLGVFGMLTFQNTQGVIQSDEGKSQNDLIRYGVGWMLFGLVPQMLIGPWLFLLLQERPQIALVEGTSLTSLIFFLSLTTALLALVLLNASFMVPHVKGLVWGGLGNVALTLAMMGIVRYETFGETLFSHHIPFAMPELSGWHVLSVLMLLILLGALLVRWCVWPSALIFHAALPTPQLDKT